MKKWYISILKINMVEEASLEFGLEKLMKQQIIFYKK